MMSIACGQAGMLISEFWNSTPREVANKIEGFYNLRTSQQDAWWIIARAMTFNIAASMVGSDKINYHQLSYFPIMEDKDRPKLTSEQTKAIIVKMDAHMKNPVAGEILGSNKDIERWASK